MSENGHDQRARHEKERRSPHVTRPRTRRKERAVRSREAKKWEEQQSKRRECVRQRKRRVRVDKGEDGSGAFARRLRALKVVSASPASGVRASWRLSKGAASGRVVGGGKRPHSRHQSAPDPHTVPQYAPLPVSAPCERVPLASLIPLTRKADLDETGGRRRREAGGAGDVPIVV